MVIDSKTVDIVNAIFKDLLSMSPGFRQSWPTDREFGETKQQWVIAFREAKLSDLDAINRGLSKVRHNPSPFPPSVGQFIEWCKLTPEDAGLPTPQAAYAEACKNANPAQTEKHWSHPAVRYAAQKTGSFFLRAEPKAKTEDVFARAYSEACEIHINGGNLNAIEHTTPKEDDELLAEYVHWLKNLSHSVPLEVFFRCPTRRARAARLHKQSMKD